ncbi:hypothetical protein E4H04_11885, partial [Candidatus Bathyarchaeota archaeon]
MNKTAQWILGLTAIVLIIITASAIYRYQTDPQTQENIKLFEIKQRLKTPINAEFLGIKQYQLLDQSITVYTWRQEDTLYEAQLDEQETIIKATIYQNNTNKTVTMTPALAETLAQQRLITETKYPPGHPNLSEPTFSYYSYRPKGPNWVVQWRLHSGNYTISNIDFAVIVYTETGETQVDYNEFNEVTMIPVFDPPTISSEEAGKIAAEKYRRTLDYAIIDSVEPGAIRISSPEEFLDYVPPLTLIWHVTVRGMGVSDGVPVRRNPTYSIDAYSGEVYCGIYISVGWDEINWKSVKHPYYGSVYPQIINHTPSDYEFPLSEEEIMSLISSPSRLLRSDGNESFPIRVYDEINLADSLSWETVILELVDDRPVIASYWSKAYDWVKTGTVIP